MKSTARGWLAGALGFFLGFVVLTALVYCHCLDALDQLTRTAILHPGPSLLRSSMEEASFWGGQSGQIAAIAVACVILWYKQRRWAVALPLVMAGAGVLQVTAKWLMNHPRPNLDPWGFPSAHVLSLVVLLGCVAYVVGTSRMNRVWRWLTIGTCASIVCTVAYSRMYLDAHWLSDILGGLSIGLAYLLIVIWLQAGFALRNRVESSATVQLAPAAAVTVKSPEL